jgi:hypothetical protein
MTFMVCATWLVGCASNVVEAAGRVPISQKPAHHMVPAKDPGTVKRRVGRREEEQAARGPGQKAGYN